MISEKLGSPSTSTAFLKCELEWGESAGVRCQKVPGNVCRLYWKTMIWFDYLTSSMKVWQDLNSNTNFFLVVVLPSTILTWAGPVQNKGMCRRTMSSISAHVGCSWKRRGGLHNHALPLEPGLFDTCPVPQQCSHPTTDLSCYFAFFVVEKLKGHTFSV